MEVRSEQGMIPNREPFPISIQKDQVHSQTPLPSMRLAYAPDGTAIYKPISAPTHSPSPFQSSTGGGATTPSSAGPTGLSSGGNGASSPHGDSTKKKRGRPRKYGTDGPMSLALVQSGPGPVPDSGSGKPISSSPANPDGKKRGRPLGSCNKKQKVDSLGSGLSGGIGFTPHVITIKAGEDVSSKIMSFCQHGSRTVCILSANGAISNVTLRQAATSGGTVTYEGRFEILSLSGSYMLSENGTQSQRSRTGGLSISLAGPDGRVLGGGVEGLLTAASPVQVIIGSFVAEGKGKKEKKEKKEKKHRVGMTDHISATSKIETSGGMLGSVSPPGGPGPASPFSSNNNNNNNNNNSGQPSFSGFSHWK